MTTHEGQARPHVPLTPLVPATVIAWALFACTTNGAEGQGAVASDGAGDGAGDGAAGSAEGGTEAATGGEAGAGEAAGPQGVALERGLGHESAVNEIWLDPRATAAVSLDASGSARLWPALPPDPLELAKLAPIRLPMHEPLSMSMARTADGGFVIAAIDTAQSTEVVLVNIEGEGPGGQARMVERFRLPPDDPLLEIHVLDGGERLLALSVDHSVRIYDGHGKLLSEFSQYGLAPWQLRFAGPPEALKIAMVLAGPTRLQRMAIVDDAVELIGEPYEVSLGRGPNHNDLALLPSGKHAAVLRRPKARTTQWSVQIHDLDGGEVRVLWGETDIKLRPRMHVIDDQRILLESGDGAGYWLDLSKGALVPPPYEQPKKLEELPGESRVEPRRVELPSSGGGRRRRASVVAGLRAVPMGDGVIFDPLEDREQGDRHYRLKQERLLPWQLALDRSGELLAMSTSNMRLSVESLGEGTSHLVTGCMEDESIRELAFADGEHLLLVGMEKAQICAWRTGKSVSEVSLPEGYSWAVCHTKGDGSGEIGLMVDTGNLDYGGETPPTLAKVGFSDNALGELEDLTRTQFADWPELDSKDKTLARDEKGRRYSLSRAQTRQFNITEPAAADGTKGEKRTLRIADEKQTFETFVAAPDGGRVALVHAKATDADYYEYEYYYYSPPSTLSVWDLSQEPAQRQLTIPASGSMELSFSGDGSRMSLRTNGRAVVIGSKGEVVFERKHGQLELEDLADVPKAEGDDEGRGTSSE